MFTTESDRYVINRYWHKPFTTQQTTLTFPILLFTMLLHNVANSFMTSEAYRGVFKSVFRRAPLKMRGYSASQRTRTDTSAAASAKSDAVAPSVLSEIIRLRGPVASGYGRGGKKLGVPTANLPESLFADALKHTATGVYFGWAAIEDEEGNKGGRNIPHKAVVNVGYSPTFEGEENREKIVEAHLIIADDDENMMNPPDFYNETMRISLIGFLRPEIKFDSFPSLLAAINQDICNARDSLDRPPFDSFRLDPFMKVQTKWVGQSGGNNVASWEFTKISDEEE